jgi:transcriptional regulator with XRE-family HTH domain
MPPTKRIANDAGTDAPSIGFRPGDRKRYELLLSYLNVSKRLLARRLELGLSQETLGRIAGTKQAKISDIELMKGNPRFDTLDKIARAVGLVIDLVPPEGRFSSTPTVSDSATQVVHAQDELVAAGSAQGSYQFATVASTPRWLA